MKKQVKEALENAPFETEGEKQVNEIWPEYKLKKSIVAITRTENGSIFVSSPVTAGTTQEEVTKIQRIGNYIRTLQKAGYQFEIVDYKIPV